MTAPGTNASKREKAVRLEERSRIAAYIRERAGRLSMAGCLLSNLAEDIAQGDHWRNNG